MGNKIDVRSCVTCGRRMRPGGALAADYPDTVSYGRDGSCTSCAARENRGSETPYGVPPTDRLWTGKPMQLVRWRNTRDGWIYDLITGSYAGMEGGNFRVVVGDQVELFPKREWEVCAA